MTFHSVNNRLLCHYCGKSLPYADKCPECGSERMKYSGLGTQRAETELESLFPEARILRMDADSTVTRGDYEKNLKAFQNGEYDILLGTQMVAKGLDFPKVTVVGVLNADIAMHSSDFRSYERTFSLLTQVVGRSGRGQYKGTAVIQTIEPDSKVIELASRQDYDAFYDSEILTRKVMVYPPYCDIATVCFSGLERQYTEDAARNYFSILKSYASDEYKDVKIIVLGLLFIVIILAFLKRSKFIVSNCENTQTDSSNTSQADELKKFKDLLDSGVITQEEFDQKKKQLLGL
jgi:primosomal protein N' (replication factor Y)